jgi:hypothetical protein
MVDCLMAEGFGSYKDQNKRACAKLIRGSVFGEMPPPDNWGRGELTDLVPCVMVGHAASSVCSCLRGGLLGWSVS